MAVNTKFKNFISVDLKANSKLDLFDVAICFSAGQHGVKCFKALAWAICSDSPHRTTRGVFFEQPGCTNKQTRGHLCTSHIISIIITNLAGLFISWPCMQHTTSRIVEKQAEMMRNCASPYKL